MAASRLLRIKENGRGPPLTYLQKGVSNHSKLPTYSPTNLPTYQHTNSPTYQPTNLPTYQPTNIPTYQPTNLPTLQPTNLPTYQPTNLPTYQPTNIPTYRLTNLPTYQHTNLPPFCIHKRISCVYTIDLLCMHNTLVHALGQGPQGPGTQKRRWAGPRPWTAIAPLFLLHRIHQ